MKCWIALALMKHDIKPEGWHTVTNRIFADDPQGLVDFIQNVFKSTGEFRTDRPTVLAVGDSMIMISGTDVRAASPAFLYVYVRDTASLLATYRRAVAAASAPQKSPPWRHTAITFA